MPVSFGLVLSSPSFRRRFRKTSEWCVSFAAVCLTAGCLRLPHFTRRSTGITPLTTNAAGQPAPASGGGTVLAERLGTVQVIGTRQRFVLVQLFTPQADASLTDGQALVCRSAGAVTASLRVSHERRPPFVVADVASGEPHVGDEVFIDSGRGNATATPPPAGSPPALFPNPADPAATPEFHANPTLPPST